MKQIPQDVSESTKRRNPHLYGDRNAKIAEIYDRMAESQGEIGTPPKRIRQSTKPLMNKLESEFKAYYETLTGHSLIVQSIRFKLGNGIWYKPDFILMCSTLGIKAFEVKGEHAFRGGFENLKVAAHQYPRISWILAWKVNNTWNQQPVLP